MSIKDVFKIEKIDNSIAFKYVIDYHYLHRKPPASISFAIKKIENDEVVGVICYAIPIHTPLRKIFGPENYDNIYDLTRLWVNDECPKNTESWFISNTIKMLDREIIVTFADIEQGHSGTIYKACNFHYLGITKKCKDLYLKGTEKKLTKFKSIEDVEAKYGPNNIEYRERPRRHKFIYLNCDNKRKKELLSKIEVFKYPKKNCMNIIYTLKDPKEKGGEIRYIGMTTTGMQRVKHHYSENKFRVRNYKTNWIKGLKKEGLTYDYEILEDAGDNCPVESLSKREIFWIKHYRDLGYRLTNSTEGGLGTQGLSTNSRYHRMTEEEKRKRLEESRPKRSEAQKKAQVKYKDIFKKGNEKRTKVYIAVDVFDYTKRIELVGIKGMKEKNIFPTTLSKFVGGIKPFKNYLIFLKDQVPGDDKLKDMINSIEFIEGKRLHKFINGLECKKCSKCKEYKELQYFSKMSKEHDGLNYYCKICDSQRKK